MPATVELDAPSRRIVWAYIPEDQVLFVSNDEGSTWSRRSLPPGQGVFPRVSFVSDMEGWLMYGGSPETQCNAQFVQLWHTVDGAKTWRPIGQRGLGDAQCKDSVSFLDSRRGFITAWDDNHRPTIYSTVDGGLTWVGATLSDPPGYATVGAGDALHASRIVGFGSGLLVNPTGGTESGQSRSFIFESEDGVHWNYLMPSLGDEVFVTRTRWLRLNDGQADGESTDGGRTWHAFANDYSDAAGVKSVFLFADDQVGYATVRGDLHRTLDGGAHWEMIKTSWP